MRIYVTLSSVEASMRAGTIYLVLPLSDSENRAKRHSVLTVTF